MGPPAPAPSHPKAKSLPLAKNALAKKPTEKPKQTSALPAVAPGLIRRESSRQVKLPSHLADDDPEAQKARMLDKCMGILKLIQEKDTSSGGYFLEPVDPVAHNIPTYHDIITNPMDLGTIQTKMEANEVKSVEEFARLMRLVFQNAVKFNDNPMNIVHQIARDLLSLFNQKFRDVERLMEKKKPTKTELKEMKRKQQKEEKKRVDKLNKRKRDEDQDPKAKQLSIIQATAEEMGKSLEALNSATSAGILQSATHVTRNEFSIMRNTIQLIHTQLSNIQTMVQVLSTSNTASSSVPNEATSSSIGGTSGAEATSSKKPRRKKTPKPQAKHVTAAPIAPVAPTSAPVAPTSAPIPPPAPVPVVEELPLTHEEQEDLTSAINDMSEDKILTVIEIIKKSKQSSDLIDDDQEIELDLDQLDTVTQRKLLKFALKNKPKKKKKAPKKNRNTTPPPAPPEPVVEPPVTETKKTEDPEFRYGNSQSDSDDDEEDPPTKEDINTNSGSAFNISEKSIDDDGEESEEDNQGFDWTNISKPAEEAPENDDSEDDNDDPWNSVREEANAQLKFDKERQEREEKRLNEQKIAKEKSLAEAAEKNKKLQAERKAKEAEESRKREQKERDEKERAEKLRSKITEDAMAVDKEIDIDNGMGGILNEFEQGIYDNDLAGGASPSSDFGF